MNFIQIFFCMALSFSSFVSIYPICLCSKFQSLVKACDS